MKINGEEIIREPINHEPVEAAPVEPTLADEVAAPSEALEQADGTLNTEAEPDANVEQLNTQQDASNDEQLNTTAEPIEIELVGATVVEEASSEASDLPSDGATA